MKKINLLLLSLLVLVGILAGCGDTSDSEENEKQDADTEQTDTAHDTEGNEFPITVEDANGKEITIDEKPEQIVSLIPSITEIVYELDLGDSLVGVSDHDNYPEEVLDKEKIGGLELNVEKILSLEPDLVLAHPTNDTDGLEQLENSGMTVFVVNDATNFDEVYESIELISQVTGTEDTGKDLITTMENDLNEIAEKAEEIGEDEKKKVYLEISPAPEIFTPGKNTFENDILELINAENVAKDEDGWVEISEEAVVEMNPDVIALTYDYIDNPIEEVMERKAWQDIDAIMDEQVYLIDTDIVSRPGPRLVEGAEKLGEAIYPQVFDGK